MNANQISVGITDGGCTTSSACNCTREVHGAPTGHVRLENLRVRKGALDKFKLPVDVVEGTYPSIC